MLDHKKNFIAGEWMSGATVRANINPSDTDDVIGYYAHADSGQVNAAIAAARDAFVTWQFSGVQQRSDILDRIGSEILARKSELGHLLAREEGKTLREGLAEVERAGLIFKFFAGEALRVSGELLPSTRSGLVVEVTREPVGVIGIVTPWNFPIAIPAWKIAPALCYGNTVVFKPADLVPASAWALTEIISRSGLPNGVFNLVMGRGATVGDALVASPDVDGVSFTGSTAVGRSIATRAVARGAKVQLEMGGKNPLIILDDAALDVAISASLQGAFGSTGQRCTASSRLIVTRGIHDRYVEAMIAELKKQVVGHALDPTTTIGPVVDEKQLQQDLRYIDLGKREGAQLLWGGDRVERTRPGFYLQPALFGATTPSMTINVEEIFGPVAAILCVQDYEEALAVANRTEFGLSCGIVTTSLRYASDFRRKAQSGMVMINAPTAGVDYHVPFGGRKQSSYGPREQGRYAAEFFTSVKTSYVQC